MRFCYADPPYIGQAKRHYAREAAAAGRVASEVDHAALIWQLQAFDGWALSASSPSILITLQRGVSGAKPDAFCFWLFEVLGMTREDEFLDLFPGSGAVTRAWKQWRGQLEVIA